MYMHTHTVSVHSAASIEVLCIPQILIVLGSFSLWSHCAGLLTQWDRSVSYHSAMGCCLTTEAFHPAVSFTVTHEGFSYEVLGEVIHIHIRIYIHIIWPDV